ncbi:MAG: penicillin-binding protein activator [Gammaproteobacteria bacterium]|jgi:outer membrane PBP1 activator LpoA protein|nr:penicillin-binding protein activator [Gammaproteobacteria bacterium]MBP6051697.1 penicillin-binding protein activator [Pseudomonadales bacterium]MBK6584706.1 penicillin-binding protein activator [Gammaproteobacteria bacterium]MBK7171039.1 penicillin-binding protein activator [Gammaproteobacteria bacterium]MBK7519785.1 penicillin-binding protein activator [Gammaproteobacteria bacterium]
MKHTARPSLLLGIALLMCACSQQPDRPPKEAASPVVVAPAPQTPVDEVQRLLARAARSDPATANDLRLDAATELADRGDTVRARELLASIEGARLEGPQWVRHQVLLARIDIEDAAPATALARLDNPAMQTESAGITRATQVDLALVRADALQALNRPVESARERSLIQAWMSDEQQRRANARAILATLSQVDMGELGHEIGSATSDDWRGWLELASIWRDLRPGPNAQRAELQNWQQRNALIPSLEPAYRELAPEILERIKQPRRIALLLPLGGAAGAGAHAVLHGYLAEHYRQLQAGESAPPFAVIDTTSTEGGFPAAYNAAVSDGAELVIGPLLKEDLQAFAGNLELQVPTIALNFDNENPLALPKLYQFGLDAGDEVAQLAREADNRNLHRTLLLADASPRARRQVEDFNKQWRARNGVVLDTLYLGDLNDYRVQLERTLLVAQSRERSDMLARTLGFKFESEPRRRQDLDFAVLLADPVAARSVRPLLSFLYAGDLPLWATSESNAAVAGNRSDQDLEALRFIDMPWFSSAEATLRRSIQAAGYSGAIERLVALGVDASRLQSRVGLLTWLNEAGLGGATGELSLDTQGRIHRRGQWYVFADGTASPEKARPETPDPSSTEGGTAWQPQEQAPQTRDAPPRITP